MVKATRSTPEMVVEENLEPWESICTAPRDYIWLRTPLHDERPCSFVIPLRLLHTTLVGFFLCAETIRKDMLTIVSGYFPEIPKFMSEVLDLAHLAD